MLAGPNAEQLVHEPLADICDPAEVDLNLVEGFEPYSHALGLRPRKERARDSLQLEANDRSVECR